MGDRSFEALPVDLVGLRLAYSRIHAIITAGIPGSCPLQDVGESLLIVLNRMREAQMYGEPEPDGGYKIRVDDLFDDN